MAATLTALSAAMSLIYMDRNTDQFRRDAPILAMLPIKTGSGKNCAWGAKIDGRTTAAAYAEGADAGSASTHTRVGAALNWAQYREIIQVSGLSAAAVASLPGTHNAGSNDLWNEEMTDGIDALALKVAEDCYSGDPAASPVELAGAATAIDSTGTFAGIDPATHASWAAGEATMALASISVATLRTNLHRPVKDATGRYPDMVTVPGNVFDKLLELSDAKNIDVINILGNDLRVASLGARAISIDGVPYVEDRHCTANTAYAWSLRDVCIRQLPALAPVGVAQVQAAIKQLTGAEVPLTDIETGLRRMAGQLTPTIEVLAQNGDAYKAQIKVYCQLEWKTRNGFSKLAFT